MISFHWRRGTGKGIFKNVCIMENKRQCFFGGTFCPLILASIFEKIINSTYCPKNFVPNFKNGKKELLSKNVHLEKKFSIIRKKGNCPPEISNFQVLVS